MALRGKRVLVTGGAGFIGSHIVESLVGQGARVIVYDNFSSGSVDNLVSVRDDIEIIEGNVLDYEKLLQAMKGVEIVSHHAAQLEIAKCIEDPVEDLKINTIGTLNVLKAAVVSGIQKVINASSACVYGQAQSLPEPEGHPTHPNWPYGVSKRASEMYTSLFQDYYGLPIVNLRYAIIYGPWEWYGRVLTIFIRRMLEGKPPVIFGDGQQIRDFTFVEDVVAMHNLCLESRKANGQTYNVSTGVGTSIVNLARLVIECAGRDMEIQFENVAPGSYSQQVAGRVRLPAELQAMVLSPAKAQQELGWKPLVSLREGIEREMTWAADHLDRWRAVHI